MGVVLVGPEGGVLLPFARACVELGVSFRWVEPSLAGLPDAGKQIAVVEVDSAAVAERLCRSLAGMAPPLPVIAVVADATLIDALLEFDVDDCAVSPVSHEGALVHLRLALSSRGPAASDVMPVSVGGSLRRPRLLVVDDEPLIGKSLAFMLSDGFEVETTTSAREALRLLDEGTVFDVLLCDLTMPEMSGAELYAELARRHPRMAERVVFLSGGVFDSATENFLAKVPNPMIEKPFDFEALRDVVSKLVEPSQRLSASG